MLEPVAEVLSEAGSAFLRQLVLGLGPLLVLGTLLFLIQRQTQKLWVRAVGWNGVVYGTGWIGTPVHELSHWIVGKLCRIEIVEMKLFEPDPNTGVLGYVRYVDPEVRLGQLHKVVGTFLMGIAPLFGGTLVLMLAWALLVTPEADGRYYQELADFSVHLREGAWEDSLIAYQELLQSLYAEIFNDPDSFKPYLFLYLALAIGTHLAPSYADIDGGKVGFLVLCLLWFLANVVAQVAEIDPKGTSGRIAEALTPLAAMLVFALILTTTNLVVGLLASLVRGRRT